MDFSKKYDNPNPVEKANILSKIFFLWQIPLFRKGLKKDLDVEDIYNAKKADLSEPLGDTLERNWNNELKKAKLQNRKPKFMKAITATFWKSFSLWGVALFIQANILKILVPIYLADLLRYFNETNRDKDEAYLIATKLLLAQFVNALFSAYFNQEMALMGMQIRVACCSLMYRKMLRLSHTSLGLTSIGNIINLMSNDVSRFDQALSYLHYIWIMPIQTAIFSYFMYKACGVAAFVGVAVIAVQAIPLQGYLSKKTAQLRGPIAQRTDERVRLMNEIVGGIQVIKMYAWEKPFELLVQQARKTEIDLLLITSYVRGFSAALMVYTERLSLYVTVVAFVLLGNDLTGDVVFSLAQYFNMLQACMAIFFPMALTNAGEAIISIKRIQEFLLQEENTNIKYIQSSPNDYSEKIDGVNMKSVKESIDEKLGGVNLRNVNASWVESQIVPTLSNITFELKPGQLCAIIGSVGSGKSSILQLLLKELSINRGTLDIHGKVSYCSQEPWLFQGSVRNNILFGLPFDKIRYRSVVDVCALIKDFEQFPHDDKTLVGDHGTSLSGGQRARVNLARAVYRKADIYLFDDPLSAVDTHVGKHLFENCIKKYLKNKTRFLVTHQLQYIETADLIIVLNNGRIEKMGTWSEISKDSSILDEIKMPREENEKQAEEVKEEERKRLHSTVSVQSTIHEEEDEPQETQELMEKGSVGGSVLWKYLRASGSLCFFIYLIVLLLLSQIASNCSDLWVTEWTNNENIRRSYFELIGENTTKSTPLNVTTVINSTIVANDTLLSKYADYVIIQQDYSIYIYSICIALSVFFLTYSRLALFKLCMNNSIGLHDTMFNNILQSTMRFFDTNPTGRILNRFSKDMGIVDEVLPRLLLYSAQVFLVMAGIMVMVGIVNPIMIAAMQIMAVLFYAVRKVYTSTALDLQRIEGISRSPVFSHVSASLDGITTIRSCGAQSLLAKEFDIQQDVHTSAWYLTVATGTAFGFWLDCVSVSFLAALIFSFILMDDGTTFGGNAGLAISQSLILTGMLQYGMRQTAEVMNNLTSVERILQYTKLEKEGPFESEPGKKPVAAWPEDGKLEFKHTYLRYNPTDEPVLKDLNFEINAGDKVGIVGRTGAGKSSLVQAIFRLAPLDGEIEIDNIATKSVGLTDLRSRISIIPQTPVLFSATLRNNLDPFNKSDDASLWQALEEVELKDLGESLDYKVNEGGSNFSAGQRQLLCLARAIVRNNKILVLDEATANVDPNTDSLIQTTIRKKFVDCTVLTIAHRLNTIMDSDKVIVMEAGRMVEYDHPHILLQQNNGYFTKMVAETGRSMEMHLRQAAKEAYERKFKSE
ncbi:probable multidrug resistance-associated protein lethal(2)03659 [Chrysoperla carnea]|uniref:probable multidrug resistance-associated protein lethal(2)03659 n=1 Tax=Chrysoperla carnea TaxID=189513 RepID=UPI001D070C48|nr:probable multidrug resistance-associated protein lethal(2)03659 [Chrysoperla carnea]